MNVTGSPTQTTSKAIFERAIKQLDEGEGSFSAARHRPIVSGRPIASVKSQEQVLQDAADALAALWRNRKR
jgi:hypothetical protein